MNANHVFSIVDACMSTTDGIVNTIMSQANDYAKYRMSQMTATNRDYIMDDIDSVVKYKIETIEGIVAHKLETTRRIIKNEMRIVTKFEGNEETRFEEIIKKGTDKINETIRKGMIVIENTISPKVVEEEVSKVLEEEVVEEDVSEVSEDVLEEEVSEVSETNKKTDEIEEPHVPANSLITRIWNALSRIFYI